MPTGITRTASIGLTFFWGIAVFCAFALVAWLLFRFAAQPEGYEDKRSKARVEKLETLRKDYDQKLNGSYTWLDKEKGTVHLPISRGIELAMTELKSKQVQASAVKVEVPYPAGLQPPPGADPGVAPVQNIGLNPSAAGPAPVGPNVVAPDVVKTPEATTPSVPASSPAASPATPALEANPAATVPPTPAAPGGSGPARGPDSTATATPASTPPTAVGPMATPEATPNP